MRKRQGHSIGYEKKSSIVLDDLVTGLRWYGDADGKLSEAGKQMVPEELEMGRRRSSKVMTQTGLAAM